MKVVLIVLLEIKFLSLMLAPLLDIHPVSLMHPNTCRPVRRLVALIGPAQNRPVLAVPIATAASETPVLVVPVAAVLKVTLLSRAVVVVIFVKSPSNPTRNFSPSTATDPSVTVEVVDL